MDHFRLGLLRNDEDISAPIAVMGHTIPMHTDGVGRATMHFGILSGKAFDAHFFNQRTPLDLTLELQLRSLSALFVTFTPPSSAKRGRLTRSRGRCRRSGWGCAGCGGGQHLSLLWRHLRLLPLSAVLLRSFEWHWLY